MVVGAGELNRIVKWTPFASGQYQQSIAGRDWPVAKVCLRTTGSLPSLVTFASGVPVGQGEYAFPVMCEGRAG